MPSGLRRAASLIVTTSAGKFELPGERAQPEPGLHIGGKLTIAGQHHAFATLRVPYAVHAHPNGRPPELSQQRA